MTRLILILLLLTGCSGGPYMGKDQFGADEFVIDSHRIRDGETMDELDSQQITSLMVMGEVTNQKTIPLSKGFMSLSQALAEAGGIRYTGDKSYIQVIRGGLSKPKIYTLSWQHIIHLPNESLLLMPGDIVFVAATPITEWHRFISQLIPSLGGTQM